MKTELLPHNTDAEDSIISSVLFCPSDFEEISGIIQAKHFYSDSHKMVFAVFENLHSRGKSLDIPLIIGQLKDRDQFKELAPGYFGDVAQIPVSVNIIYHAEQVVETYTRREIIKVAHGIIKQAHLPGGVDSLGYAQSEMLKIEPGVSVDEIKTLAQVIDDRIDGIEQANTQQQLQGCRMGFECFDQRINLIGPKLIIVAARPRMGKTSFALNIAKNMAQMGTKVGFLSLEMSADELSDRLLAAESKVDSWKFAKFQGLNKNEWQALTGAAGNLDLPILIDDSGGCAIEDIERKCRKLKSEGCKAIFIDQLSQFKRHRGVSELEHYSVNTNRVAQLKKELRVPIFLLAQLNRDVEKRNDREPQLSDLKNTGSLEEDADMIFFIMRPEEYAPNDPNLKGVTVINLAKHRQGSTWRESEQIRFDGPSTTFYEI